MPRGARIVLPDHPHHIVQRGHNGRVLFAGINDYAYYLANIEELKSELGCRVFAYCLMTNHIHLIVDPGVDTTSLGLLMKRVAGRQTRYTNSQELRRGTLWESRYKSSPIDTDRYLLACCRYVETNPVRAGIVTAPEQYRWSSFRVRAGFQRRTWLDLDPCYETLGADDETRANRYRKWIRACAPVGEWDLFRNAVRRGHPSGSDRFSEEVSRTIGRRVEARGPGRPKQGREIDLSQ